jgi:hypothetical protein
MTKKKPVTRNKKKSKIDRQILWAAALGIVFAVGIIVYVWYSENYL